MTAFRKTNQRRHILQLMSDGRIDCLLALLRELLSNDYMAAVNT